mmetsp:Transcript_81195/g.230014  ORF Transcript_81195/g.230014 Transcript_81195/m.230014 type:complete len:289 (-) Transcript_81195:109-975(-)
MFVQHVARERRVAQDVVGPAALVLILIQQFELHLVVRAPVREHVAVIPNGRPAVRDGPRPEPHLGLPLQLAHAVRVREGGARRRAARVAEASMRQRVMRMVGRSGCRARSCRRRAAGFALRRRPRGGHAGAAPSLGRGPVGRRRASAQRLRGPAFSLVRWHLARSAVNAVARCHLPAQYWRPGRRGAVGVGAVVVVLVTVDVQVAQAPSAHDGHPQPQPEQPRRLLEALEDLPGAQVARRRGGALREPPAPRGLGAAVLLRGGRVHGPLWSIVAAPLVTDRPESRPLR